jgi:hypothetical protein
MNEKIKRIVEEVNSNDGKIPQHLIDPIFEIHNSLFSIKEFNKGCGSCRRRTFGRLQTYYNDNILGK